MKSNHYSILIFSETWLHGEINNHILTADTDFSIIRSDRTGKGGGLAIFLNNHFNFLIIAELNNAFINGLIVDILNSIHEPIFRIVAIYLSPKGASSPKAVDEITDWLSSHVYSDVPISIIGDFNFSGYKFIYSNYSNGLLNFLSGINFIQMISTPTRDHNFLDLLFTDQPNLISSINVDAPFTSTCDHNVIKFTLDIQNSPKQKNKAFRDFGSADYEKINAYLSKLDWKLIL